MKIKGYKKYKIGRRYVMATKTNQKISVEELLIDEIENSSNDSWDELCNTCSSLIKDARMTNKDIDIIVERVKSGKM